MKQNNNGNGIKLKETIISSGGLDSDFFTIARLSVSVSDPDDRILSLYQVSGDKTTSIHLSAEEYFKLQKFAPKKKNPKLSCLCRERPRDSKGRMQRK